MVYLMLFGWVLLMGFLVYLGSRRQGGFHNVLLAIVSRSYRESDRFLTFYRTDRMEWLVDFEHANLFMKLVLLLVIAVLFTIPLFLCIIAGRIYTDHGGEFWGSTGWSAPYYFDAVLIFTFLAGFYIMEKFYKIIIGIIIFSFVAEFSINMIKGMFSKFM